MKTYDMLIVGSGISGMSLGYYCAKEGLKTGIVEKDDRMGGAFHSQSFSDSSEAFWLELGAHTCYNSYGNFLQIVEGCRIAEEIRPRAKVPFKILLGSRVRSIPSCINFLELLVSVPRLFTLRKEGESVASYYGRIVGKGNFEKVFSHLFNSVLSQETGDFPADMLFKKRPRRKDVLKSYTFRRGVQTLIDAVSVCEGIEIHSGHEVISVREEGRLFQVALQDGNVFEAPKLALAVPASAAASLLREAHPALSQELAQIGMAHIESMGVVVEKEKVSLPLFAGMVAAQDSFYSIVSRDTVPHDRYRGFTFHFKPQSLDRAGKIERICKVLGLSKGNLSHVIEKENILPALRREHQDKVRRIDDSLREKSLYLTGNYFGGVAIEDCVTRSFSEFQRMQNKQ